MKKPIHVQLQFGEKVGKVMKFFSGTFSSSQKWRSFRFMASILSGAEKENEREREGETERERERQRERKREGERERDR